MASTTLRAVYLHRADDLADYLALENCVEVEEDTSGPSEVRLFASGLTRRSSMRGTTTFVNLHFDGCTRAEVDTLRDWQDDILLFRDPRGRLHYGSYDAKQLQVSEHLNLDRADVAIRFAVVSSYTSIPVSGGG